MNNEMNKIDTSQVEVSVIYQLELANTNDKVCLSTVKVDYEQELGFGIILDQTDGFSRTVPLIFISIDDAKEFRNTYYNKIRKKSYGFIKDPYLLQIIEIKGKRSLCKIHSNIDVFVSLANYKYIQPKLDKLNSQSQKAIKERKNLLSYYSWLQGIRGELKKSGWTVNRAHSGYVNQRETIFLELTDGTFTTGIHLFNSLGKSEAEIFSPQKLKDWRDFFKWSSDNACIYNYEFTPTLTKESTSVLKTVEKISNILKKYYSVKTVYTSKDKGCEIILNTLNNLVGFYFYWTHTEVKWDWNVISRLHISEQEVGSSLFDTDIWLYILLTCYCYMNYNKSLVFDFQKDGYKPIIDFLNYVTTINYENAIKDMLNRNLINLVETSKEMLEQKN